MSFMPILRRIAFSFYDYKTTHLNSSDVKFAVIHIPDQVGDAMSIFPLIRSLERQQIAHLLIVASEKNKTVFDALSLAQTKLTIISMTWQDNATLKEIKDVAKNIRRKYGVPDLCIDAMRKKNLKTIAFVGTLKSKMNFQAVDFTMRCYSPICKMASRMDQKFRAPVPMTWAILMREAGFPVVKAAFELPISDEVLTEVSHETTPLGRYIAVNLEGSAKERTFSLAIAHKLISLIKEHTELPIIIVHGPAGVDSATALIASFDNVHHLSLSPSIPRSAAVIKDAFFAITPDTSILHMASAYNTPVIAVYTDYKTRWPAMSDVAERIVVGKHIDNINLDEFRQSLMNIISRIL